MLRFKSLIFESYMLTCIPVSALVYHFVYVTLVSYTIPNNETSFFAGGKFQLLTAVTETNSFQKLMNIR